MRISSDYRWHRMLCWILRWPSPSLGRHRTLREAWTGRVEHGIDLDGMMQIAAYGPDSLDRARKKKKR